MSGQPPVWAAGFAAALLSACGPDPVCRNPVDFTAEHCYGELPDGTPAEVLEGNMVVTEDPGVVTIEYTGVDGGRYRVTFVAQDEASECIVDERDVYDTARED